MRHSLVRVPIRIADDQREGIGPAARASHAVDDEPADRSVQSEEVGRQASLARVESESSADVPRTMVSERQANESRRAFLLRLLSVADNLKRALNYARPDDGLSEGVRLTYRQLLEALRTEGVEPIESIGRPFDPSVHEAVAVAPGYPREGIVVKEETKGYWHEGKLLRPSRVVVSS